MCNRLYTVDHLGKDYKSVPTIVTTVRPSQVLIYDKSFNGKIEKAEAMAAVKDYLLGNKISKAVALAVVKSYLFGNTIIATTPTTVWHVGE